MKEVINIPFPLKKFVTWTAIIIVFAVAVWIAIKWNKQLVPPAAYKALMDSTNQRIMQQDMVIKSVWERVKEVEADIGRLNKNGTAIKQNIQSNTSRRSDIKTAHEKINNTVDAYTDDDIERYLQQHYGHK